MKKIFISYSSKDEDFVTSLSAALRNNGVECWYSEESRSELGNWAGEIARSMKRCDFFIVILSEASITSGQVLNEIRLASQLNLQKIPIKLSHIALPEEITYHLPLNAIEYYRITDDAALYKMLLDKMNCHLERTDVIEAEKAQNHRLYSVMKAHTSDLFSDVEKYGGYSWGVNKSVIQNGEGGWSPENIIIEDVDDESFEFPEEYESDYNQYYNSSEFQKMIRRGQNQIRWMLTGFFPSQNKLLISLKKTEWSQTQFSWHRIMVDEKKRAEAINEFFEEEQTNYPNSFCLHLILIDSNNAVVATRIKKRKKNDYPSTIAITLGEQINSSDFQSGVNDNFVMQWLKRALYEEFGFDDRDYFKYLREDSARVMSLNLEGDIFNFGLVCCVRLNCTCSELYEFYLLHRSSDDEFDELFPITTEEIPSVLNKSTELSEMYHPSSFLRLLFAFIYVSGKLPEIAQDTNQI